MRYMSASLIIESSLHVYVTSVGSMGYVHSQSDYSSVCMYVTESVLVCVYVTLVGSMRYVREMLLQ